MDSDSDTPNGYPLWRRSVRRCQRPPRPGPDHDGAEAADAPVAVATVETRSPDPARPAQRRPALKEPPSFTVESIFRNFNERRVAFIRALTKDEEALLQKCDPGLESLHLYGGTDGSWGVKPPEFHLPALKHEPTTLGIKKLRDTLKRHEWMEEVAIHCDAWLIRISYFYGAYLTAKERDHLFNMIISLPTVQETFLDSDTYRKVHLVEEKRSSGPVEAIAVAEEEVYPVGEQRSSDPSEGKEVGVVVEVHYAEEKRSNGSVEANEVEEEEEVTNEDSNFCASCGDHYNKNGFWIKCDFCERWYHGKYVKITSSEAEDIEDYECPDCCFEKLFCVTP